MAIGHVDATPLLRWSNRFISLCFRNEGLLYRDTERKIKQRWYRLPLELWMRSTSGPSRDGGRRLFRRSISRAL